MAHTQKKAKTKASLLKTWRHLWNVDRRMSASRKGRRQMEQFNGLDRQSNLKDWTDREFKGWDRRSNLKDWTDRAIERTGQTEKFKRWDRQSNLKDWTEKFKGLDRQSYLKDTEQFKGLDREI